MNTTSAFTLLELIIALVIVSLLLTISYPLYIHHLVKVKRRQAEVSLTLLASRLEEYHSLEGTYRTATPALLKMQELMRSLDYVLKIKNATDDNFLISAVPKSVQAKKDSQCNILSVNEKGEHFISGTGKITQCWSEL